MSNENDKMSTGITRVLWGHGVTLAGTLLVTVLATSSRRISDVLEVVPVILWFWAGWVFLFQLAYVIPLSISAKVKNQKETLKGILVAFGVTFLLSGLTCGGILILINDGKISI